MNGHSLSLEKSPLPTSSYLKPLNEDLYNPDEESKHFFKLETGIQDEDELKEHIVAVQNKAFRVR